MENVHLPCCTHSTRLYYQRMSNQSKLGLISPISPTSPGLDWVTITFLTMDWNCNGYIFSSKPVHQSIFVIFWQIFPPSFEFWHQNPLGKHQNSLKSGKEKFSTPLKISWKFSLWKIFPPHSTTCLCMYGFWPRRTSCQPWESEACSILLS